MKSEWIAREGEKGGLINFAYYFDFYLNYIFSMKKYTTLVDRFVLLCRDVDKTSTIYCDALGLKMVLQSPELVELRDNNDLKIFLKATKKPFQLSKGYSPILSFRVENFDEVRQKLLRNQLIEDGKVV